ncbi:TPA: hypothetical protein MAL24_004547 [Klebsiella pneumoniae]|uniref:DUF7828 domain-containing protein n=1 Tax=Klebsiella pneumoniae TaxID=573 RepID=UPI0010BBE710|nr:hypothetical protein [Klebsiella pneumoniae]EIX9801249.1 hypothetical protein [Klebsiella pneumoniae]EJK8058257.1 hypothetical protein [Klebsiella pneumoniae]EJM8258739.1 hypothetical protein [Klebsiella pneumoniae]EKT9958202.1 hypothetical protein [Klebsiella pneumoniae]
MTIYAKCFIALDANKRLTGATTGQLHPYDSYTCHFCGSNPQYHPEYITERPWFAHRHGDLTENGRQHCPYVNPDSGERQLARRLQHFIPNAILRVSKADWLCAQCETS